MKLSDLKTGDSAWLRFHHTEDGRKLLTALLQSPEHVLVHDEDLASMEAVQRGEWGTEDAWPFSFMGEISVEAQALAEHALVSVEKIPGSVAKRRVVSKPKAVIEVTELHLTPAAQRVLKTGLRRLP